MVLEQIADNCPIIKEKILALPGSGRIGSCQGTVRPLRAGTAGSVRMSQDDANGRDDKFLTGEEFKIWRRTRGLSLAETAKWVGLTYQAIQAWERFGVTKTQALALSAIDRGLKPWRPTDAELKATHNTEQIDDADES